MVKTIINYGKTWQFTPNKIETPISVEALQDIVKSANKIRVVGAAHSWSKGIITDDTLISLDKMNRLLKIDKEKKQVSVQAGIKLKALIEQLEAQDLAFINLGSIDGQSLAGALCTGTHGTGIDYQCMASQVESFKLIDADGNIQIYHKSDDDFYGVLVGFGAFGIIYEMVLNVTERFQMHAITTTTTYDDLLENLDNYVKNHHHFKLWWLVPNEKVVIFKQNRTKEKRNDSDFMRWFKDEFLSVIVYRSLVAIGKRNRKKFIPPINNFLTNEVGKHFERICKSYIAFLTPVPPIHRETEWAFDYKDAKRLLKEYRELLPADGHMYNFVQEIRFTKGDDFWLSPAYQRDSIWLSMYNMDTDKHWDEQLAKFEKWAKANGGRPHWGKESKLDSKYLRTQYTQLPKFYNLMRSMDMQGKFANVWVQKVFKVKK